MDGPGFVIGNIAKGKDLWNRQEEINAIWKALEKSSVLLKAPRRFGKSSIMFNIYENAQKGFKAIFEDTEGMRDPQDFIARLMAKMLSDKRFWNNVKDWLKKNFSSVAEVGFSLARFEDINIADFRIKIKESIGEDWHGKGFELISK